MYNTPNDRSSPQFIFLKVVNNCRKTCTAQTPHLQHSIADLCCADCQCVVVYAIRHVEQIIPEAQGEQKTGSKNSCPNDFVKSTKLNIYHRQKQELSKS